jgi:hypothetical protein
MKVLLSLVAVLSLAVLTTACNRDNRSEDGIQREEDLRSEDFRETDTYNRSVPVSEDEMELERDRLNMGPNKSSVTE